MTLITRNEKPCGNNQRNVFDRFRLRIKKGPSREQIRDAIGIDISVSFDFSVPRDIDEQFGFLRSSGLTTDIYSLTWINGVDDCRGHECFLRGKFGPITDDRFSSRVYWGSFIAKYDVRKRIGDMSITLNYVYEVYRG